MSNEPTNDELKARVAEAEKLIGAFVSSIDSADEIKQITTTDLYRLAKSFLHPKGQSDE